MSAYRDGDRIVVLLPAAFTAAEERHWIGDMVERLRRQAERQRGRPTGDDELMIRATELSTMYLEGRARPTSVRWVSNQQRRWGSCTPGEGSIRLSDRLRVMPSYVVDYVLVHELAHLIVSGHGERFWDWVRHYPSCERARGFLEGVESAHLR